MVLMALAVYFRFYHDLHESNQKTKVIYTLLSLCILLCAFRIVIDILVILYKIDRESKTLQMRDNLIVGLSNLYSIFTVFAFIVGSLSILGLSATKVFTSISIVAAALAIISKEFITDIIIGLINGFSTKIELDDYVKVGEQRGKILDMGLQKITLQNDDDDIVYIPNTTFYNSEIINYTKKDIRRMSIEFILHIKYIRDIEVLEKNLNSIISEFEDHVEKNSGTVKIVHIEKDHIKLKYQYTLKEVSRDIHRNIRKQIMRFVSNYVVSNSKDITYED
jgi:small-conductance mechanosensitive channel